MSEIRFMTNQNYDEVKNIYEHGIEGGISTFQKIAPDWETFDRDHLKKCRLVYVNDKNDVCGWVALSSVSIMEALNGVGEVSIYVHKNYVGQGIGTNLLMTLQKVARKQGFWSLQSTILPENKRSIALHEKCGFRRIGYRERIAQMPNGEWRDVILFEKRLEGSQHKFNCINYMQNKAI